MHGDNVVSVTGWWLRYAGGTSELARKRRSFWRDEAKVLSFSVESRDWFILRIVGAVLSFALAVVAAMLSATDSTVSQWAVGAAVFCLLLPSIIAFELYFRGSEAGERLIEERDAARNEAQDYKSRQRALVLERQRHQLEHDERAAEDDAIPKLVFEGSVQSSTANATVRIPFRNTGGPAVDVRLSPVSGVEKCHVRPSTRIETGQTGDFQFQGKRDPKQIRPAILPGVDFSVTCRDDRGREHIFRYKYTGTVYGFEMLPEN